MVRLRRLTLLLLVVALLLSPPEVGTASGKTGGIVDETLVWNQVMLDAIVAGTLGNPQTMRMAATVNTAMFDARNSVGRRSTPIFVTRPRRRGTHRRAAVVQAAYVTLKAFYPEQLARFDTARACRSPSSRVTPREPSSAASRGARGREASSGVACDRRLHQPGPSIQRCRRRRSANGSRRPAPDVASQHLLYRAIRADQ